MSSPWSSQSGYRGPEQRALSSIYKAANDGTRDFQRNLMDLNQSVSFMSQYLTVMQKGIDDANKNIIQKIQDFIQDLIIIFGGGETGDSGFDFGDLKYIIQAIGSLFGLGPGGPIDLLGAALHFLENFLQPLGLLGDIINGFIKSIFEFFASLLSNVPVVGDTLSAIVNNIASGINTTTSTANTASSTASTAQSTATAAQGTATAANSLATTAQSQASTAANQAAAALEKADKAYINAQYWKDEFSVSASAIVYGANDETLGMFMDVPSGKRRVITAVNYRMGTNSGTMQIVLVKRDINNVDTDIWTTNVPSASTSYRDIDIDYEVADRTYIRAEVRAIGGTATALHCALIGVLVDI